MSYDSKENSLFQQIVMAEEAGGTHCALITSGSPAHYIVLATASWGLIYECTGKKSKDGANMLN